MKIIDLSLKEIRPDFFFCFSSPSDISLLKCSISASGIRTPLHVVQTSRGFRLLSGFKRHRAAAELKMETLPAVKCAESAPMSDMFHEVLMEHLSCRSLNLIEKARVLVILRNLSVPEDHIRDCFLPLVGLPNRKDVIDEVAGLLCLAPRVLEYIETADISLKQTAIFKRISADEQTTLADLGFLLQVRIVELSEIIVHLHEIAIRESKTILQVYREMKLEQLIRQDGMSRNEKLESLKKTLREKRYPQLWSWNERLAQLQNSMALPPRTNLSWDRTLETPGIQLHAEIRSLEDVRRIAVQFSDKDNLNKFAKMLRRV